MNNHVLQSLSIIKEYAHEHMTYSQTMVNIIFGANMFFIHICSSLNVLIQTEVEV